MHGVVANAVSFRRRFGLVLVAASTFLVAVVQVDRKIVTSSSSSSCSSSMMMFRMERVEPPSHAARRLKLLDDKCHDTLPHLPAYQYQQLYRTVYADRRLRYFYCATHKVATTSILRSLALANGAPQDLKLKVHLPNQFVKQFMVLNKTEQRIVLRDSFKFMFVRHPFERLVSAYIDKFPLTHLDLIPNAFSSIATAIKRKYRSSNARKDDNITFAEFIQYIVDSETARPFDMHWRPYSELCQPCGVKYDFIGHYETLREDVEYVLKKLGIDGVVQLPGRDPRGARNSSQLVKSYFAILPAKHLKKLREIYLADFSMFGYDWNIFGT